MNKFSKYGLWKDVKLFANYIHESTLDSHHPFIELMIDLLVKQLKEDEENYKKQKAISTAPKWTPREKSKYGWLFKKIAIKFSPHLFTDIQGSRALALRKANMILRRFLSKMNRYTNNTEMLMCARSYHMIDFSKVSATTIHKNILAFQNIKNDNKTRFTKWDRYIGAGKFRKFIEQSKIIDGASQIQIGEAPTDDIASLDSVGNRFGMRLVEITESLRHEYRIKEKNGLMVVSINQTGIAWEAGLRQQDIIVKVNRKPVK